MSSLENKASNNGQKKILVVEDEETLRYAIGEMLRTNHYIYLEAKNGEEGLGIALRECPDLILLDLLMPVMDGITMLKLLRADSWGKGVPVIVLTNFNPKDDEVLMDVVSHESLHYLIKSDLAIQDVFKEINKVFT